MSVVPGKVAVVPPTDQMLEVDATSDDIRRMSQGGGHVGVRQRLYGLEARLDRSVTFEEYTYWAKIEREMEEEEYRGFRAIGHDQSKLSTLKGYFVKNRSANDESHDDNSGAVQIKNGYGSNMDEKDGTVSPVGPSDTHHFDAEWRSAARALRTASWGGVFYLITTDILGWGQTPYVFANTGYGLGVGIFVLMGLAAGFSGWMIWQTFLGLDSSRYPMLSYGDPFFRLFGPKARHFINVLQSIQMFLSVAILLLGQTGVIAQLAGSVNLCFIVCAIIILVVGIASGYVRALKHIAWFSSAAVWLNIISFIIICVAAAKYGPDPTAQVKTGILPKIWAEPGHMEPVKTFVNAPPVLYQPTTSDLFAAKFNGINSMVYAFSGAVLFVAFLAEMRHPMDFWKAIFLAQTFITVIYVFFGAFAYTFYGQYAYTTITQVVQPLSLQIVNNVLGLITGWLALFLYFNVGMKTVYLEVGQEILSLPPITTRPGKIMWWSLGPLYWILAFVVAMSIPQFGAFTNFVGGLFSLNFTYSFSGIMFLAYKIQNAARLPGEGFDPVSGQTTRHDDGWRRWARGFFKCWYISVPVLIYTGCGLATSGMGTWAATLALEAAFGPTGSVQTSWTCVNPYYNP